MTAASLIEVVQEAVDLTGMTQVPVADRTALLTDRGPSYLFAEHLQTKTRRWSPSRWEGSSVSEGTRRADGPSDGWLFPASSESVPASSLIFG